MAQVHWSLVLCALLGLSASSCVVYPSAPPPPGTPLTAAIGGRAFVPRGIAARRERDGLAVFVFERDAPCGTPGAAPLPNDTYFIMFYPNWDYAAVGTRISLRNSRVIVNTSRPSGVSQLNTSLGGVLDVVDRQQIGGTVLIDVRNSAGENLRGQLSFPICRDIMR